MRFESAAATRILFPIGIADYILTKWQHTREADVVGKVVGDFSRWEKRCHEIRRCIAKVAKGVEGGE